VAVRMYARRPINQGSSEWVSAPTLAARNDLYGDAVNEAVFMRPGRALTKSLIGVERRGIDGAVEALAGAVSDASISMRRIQTGFARSYALSIFVGATLVVAMVVMVRLS